MAARHSISGAAHSCLNDFAELLRKYPAEKAVRKFSERIKCQKLDVVSKNALRFVTREANAKKPKEELLSKVYRVKRLLDSCTSQLSVVAARTLRNKKVVVHPVSRVVVPLIKSAKKVRFISAERGLLKSIPGAEAHKPLMAPRAIENTDFVILVPKAISKNCVVVENRGRLISELARARGVPVYALVTSLHIAHDVQPTHGEESIPPEMISAVISEHGTYAYSVFFSRIQNAFPWITSLP